ncbi:MAG: NAD(P)-binding domain-containing protein [Flavobacteriales bacterium]|nr:NAD(P)-binding domain-containing protein [Flavobacteriales bacterium]
MKIGIFGTGGVGRTIAAKLARLGHDVVIGTRDPKATLANTEKGPMGGALFSEWHKEHPTISLRTFAEAAAHGELLINATSGFGSLEALKLAGDANLGTKALLDISNPLDFSRGMPPSLFVSNTDSLGEQLQKAFPQVRVVKGLNTLTAGLMVDPAMLPERTNLFLCGNDAAAKDEVRALLKQFGWADADMIDLGDITNARGTEMVLPVWIRLWGALQTPFFNFRIVKAG